MSMSMSVSGAAPDLASGKGHKDENFPVASFIIKPRHRAVVMAFYRFARKGDDIADHPAEAPAVRLELLERMRATLAGEADVDAEALALRRAQEARGLTGEHGLDLLEAFRRDVTKSRYANWAELMDYCRYSAMPVGRFVLDVHGEDRALWPANDALCAALQVINHLQDCAKDHAALDRVYLPEETLAANGAAVADLAAPRGSAGLRATIRDLAQKTWALLEQSRPFAAGITDGRLAYEVALIQRLAEDLTRMLLQRDPLSERVHHTKLETLGLAALAARDRMVGRGQVRRAA
jgi:hydroxysqualene synthase